MTRRTLLLPLLLTALCLLAGASVARGGRGPPRRARHPLCRQQRADAVRGVQRAEHHRGRAAPAFRPCRHPGLQCRPRRRDLQHQQPGLRVPHQGLLLPVHRGPVRVLGVLPPDGYRMALRFERRQQLHRHRRHAGGLVVGSRELLLRGRTAGADICRGLPGSSHSHTDRNGDSDGNGNCHRRANFHADAKTVSPTPGDL